MGKNNTESLTIQAYNILKERIIKMQLRPGELILVQPLSKELGISRTPVREAIIKLEEEGFLEATESKKFRVTQLTIKNILEIHEIRELIELHCATKAAIKRKSSHIKKFNNLSSTMEKALQENNTVKFFEADMEFHSEIIHLSNNQTLENIMFQLTEKVQRIRYITTHAYHRVEDTIAEHDDIIKAIEKQNPEKAARAMKKHLTNVKQSVLKLFEDGTMELFGGVSF